MPSQWQQRFPSERVETSLSDWIEDVQRRADINEPNILPDDADDAPTDADVADVIARMEQLLSDHNDNESFNFDDYLESSSNDSFSQISIDDHIDSFQTRSMKRCFDELRRHCKGEKKRLGWIEKLVTKQQRMKLMSKYLLTWKSVNRMIRVKEAMLACKIGRATSNKFRRAFVEWKRLMLLRREQLSKVDSRLRRKVYRRVISVLMQNRESSLLVIERARERSACKIRAKVLTSWRVIVRNQRKLVEKTELFHRARVIRQCFGAWSSLLPRSEPLQTPQNNHKNDQVKNATQNTTLIDDDKLLRPLRNPRRRQSRSNSTPKIMSDMAHRNKERLQRKEVLRSRKERAAIAKKQMLDAERHSKEERELRVHNEYLRKKKTEKEQKEQEVIRNREASRLAVLHHKVSLQKHCLLQWKRIFGINGWNDRKARVFLRDSLYEKYFFSWFQFSRNKALRIAKRHHIAVDFHETSLLAKAFASLEENVKHTNHLYLKAASRISTLRKQSVLREWYRNTVLLAEERETKEFEVRRMHQTYLLRRALHAWKVGIEMTREEARMEQLVDEKYAAMIEWLEASRKHNDPY